MNKKYKIVSILAAVTMLVSILTLCTMSVCAEQQGSTVLEYTHVVPAANGGTEQGSNTQDGSGQSNEQNNVKTGDATASIVGVLSVAAIFSACTAWFALKKKKTAD